MIVCKKAFLRRTTFFETKNSPVSLWNCVDAGGNMWVGTDVPYSILAAGIVCVAGMN